MGQRKFNSRALRQLAEDLIRRIAPEAGIPEEEWGDLATSLVRQWITYDGSAALFLGEQQVYLAPGWTPPGKPATEGGAVVGNELLAAPDATLVGVFRYRARPVRPPPGEGQVVSWAGQVGRG
jgi:hypothetical protein